MSADTDARQKRLRKEQGLLEEMNRNSDHVKALAVTPVGGAPERYIVTFDCRGITGIDGAKNPIYGNKHEVEIYCHADFPSEPPRLKWITPIWHPNIRHKGAKDVCVNPHEWLGGMTLYHLCWQMFDMVQYINYHAEPTEPFPLDHEAAEWVMKFAEPRGIVDRRRGVAVDNRPFLRGKSLPTPLLQTVVVEPPPRPRLRWATAGARPDVSPEPAPLQEALPRMGGRAAAVQEPKMETGIPCRSCRMMISPEARVCGSCGTPVSRVRFAS